MSQDMIQKDESEESQNIFQSIKWAGGTFIGFGVVDALGHLGPTGLVVGAIGSYLSYQYGPKCYAAMMRQYDTLDPQSKATIQAAMSRFRHTPVEEIEESHAQPKDDTRRVVDVSEDEYLAPLPTPEPAHIELAPIFPAYPENETMHLGKVVATGQRFDPSINNFLGYGAIFAGSQGSGKSVAVAVVAEHLGERGVSEVLFDMKREYFSILKVVANGIVAGHPDAAHSQDFQGLPFYGLTVENAAEFAADVMEKGYQAVVDIPSFLEHSGNDWNLVARVITAVQDGLMRWSIAQDDQERLPCLIGYDEAHIFFPQNAEMKNLFDMPVLNKLNASTFSMVNMGRSYGYTMLFSTQRIANIAKWTIGNCQIKVIMRHSVDVDLERCSKEIGKDEKGKLYATEQDIKTLPAKQGYGYVLGFTQEPYLIQFDMRRSYHPSNTPTMERVQQRKVKSAQPVQVLPELFEEEESHLSMHDLCEAVIQMAEMHYKAGEIIQFLEIDAGEYLDCVAYIRSHRSEFGSSTPDTQITPVRANLSVVRPELRETPGASATLPEQRENEPVEPTESNSGTFLARGDDLLLSELQAELLMVFYRNCNNVAKSLEQIKNDRGQGLGGRYTRHASYLLEQAGLKKRRA